MSEIIITIMILVSALAVRDAIIYECSRTHMIKKLSPAKFATAAIIVSLFIIWILLIPLKRFITGKSDDKVHFYDRIVSLVISVSFLICALSLREASCGMLCSGGETEAANQWTPWAWAFLVIFSTAVLIFSVVVCK